MPRLEWLLAVVILSPLALGQGCYLAHGLGGERFAGEDAGAGPRRDAGLAEDAIVPDAVVPDDGGEIGPDVEVPTLCEMVCSAGVEAGCWATEGCMRGCLGRADQAARVSCLPEWKGVTRCLIDMPCTDGICGETSGWPECIGARG